MDGQVAEQGLIAGEEFTKGIQEQRLAEAPGPGEEVILALVDQSQREAGLVDVVKPPFPDFAEILDADGEAFAGVVAIQEGRLLPDYYGEMKLCL